MTKTTLLVPVIGGALSGKTMGIETPLPNTVNIPANAQAIPWEELKDKPIGSSPVMFGMISYTLGWGAVAGCCGLLEPVYIWLPDDPAMTVPPEPHPNCPCEPVVDPESGTLDIELSKKPPPDIEPGWGEWKFNLE